MLNDAQKQALEEEFNKSEYTELVQSGRAIDLTDYLNAPRLLVTDNPEEQGTVTIVPSVSDLFVPAAEGGDPIIPYAEQGELRIGMWDDLVVSVGVGEATVRIDNVLRLNGTEAPRIYKVGELLIEHAPALLPAFLGLLAADGKLSAETAGAIQAAMIAPDPNWSAEIYLWEESIASSLGLPRLQPADVTSALG